MNRRRHFVWIAFLAVVILLNLPVPASMRISNASRDAIAPFQNVMSLVIHRVSDYFHVLIDAGGALEKLQEKNLEIARLRRELQSAESISRENDNLRKLLGFVRRSPHELVSCQVVARNGTAGWWQTLELNKGTSSGVTNDLAVITQDGLVGRTVRVSRRSSEVMLLTDPNCRVPCTFGRSGGFGVVRGGGVSLSGREKLDMLYRPEPLSMDYIGLDRAVRSYDEVTTSGLSDVFPPGLLVGFVSDVRVHRSDLYKIAEVVPAADLGNLRYVFVVRRKNGEHSDQS